jgi:hypothetical protein
MGYNGCRGLEGSQIEQQQEQCERFFNRLNESGGRFRFREATARSRQIFQQFRGTDNRILEHGFGQPKNVIRPKPISR